MIQKEIVQILFIKGSFFRGLLHFLKNLFSFTKLTNKFLNINFLKKCRAAELERLNGKTHIPTSSLRKGDVGITNIIIGTEGEEWSSGSR